LREAGIDARAVPAQQPDGRHQLGEAGGRPGRVTVCVDPVGRCSRVGLDPRARAAGGLAVIATHAATSRRAARRLAYLAGHHGHPGSVETIAMLALPGVLAYLPGPVMRSLVHAGRFLAERQAERRRRQHARQSSLRSDSDPVSSPRQAPHLQPEGS
jgi:preprotein translocase subunit SecA